MFFIKPIINKKPRTLCPRFYVVAMLTVLIATGSLVKHCTYAAY